MTTGERIKQRRIELGLTQLELAKKLGYTSKAAISKIEKQGNDVTLKTVKKFSKVLCCTPSYLMGWQEEPPKARNLSEINVYEQAEDPKVAERKPIIDQYTGFPESTRKRLRMYIQAMLDAEDKNK